MCTCMYACNGILIKLFSGAIFGFTPGYQQNENASPLVVVVELVKCILTFPITVTVSTQQIIGQLNTATGTSISTNLCQYVLGAT